ncbi:MAG: PQQ-binding-like beta-propeller repeat protein [Nitrososphaerota archaeon]|nr:PQQ-binding-like beta-propeller repeat protein [Nitrososphaerota archaeon]
MIASTITMLTASTSSNAQQSQTVNVKIFLSVRPTTVGLGQEILINMWISPAPGAHRMYHNLTVIITNPDGKQFEYTVDTYHSDGTMWMPYVCDQVGEWFFQIVYPGETFLAGTYVDGKHYAPDEPFDAGTLGSTGSAYQTYAGDAIVKPASSPVLKITVQEEMIPSWPETPPPTDYWTRPVDEIHREWWPYIGSYPWFGPAKDDPLWNALYPRTNPAANSEYGFTPWVTGPESAHVVWKREYTLSGLMGGDYGSSSYMAELANLRIMKPQIILLGKAYHSYTKVAEKDPSAQTYWECYDIRTGETYWERPLYAGESAPNLIAWTTGAARVIGGQEKPSSPELLSISNGYLRKYNPFTGVMTANVSIAPLTGSGGTYYMNEYVLGVQNLGNDVPVNERYRLINWTTAGTSANFTDRVVSNVTYARSALPSMQLTDWNEGIGAVLNSVNIGGLYVGQNITGIDLYTGRTLWTKYIEEPQYSTSACVADHGKIAVLTAHGHFLCFDLRTGNQVWQTRTLNSPWDATGFGAYAVLSAYGQFYWSAQSAMYAIDWNTGEINWVYEKESPPFETPYTGSEGQPVWGIMNAAIIADEKIYIYLSEHTPETPFYRGQPMVCINAITGEEVWSVAIRGNSDARRTELQLAIADGYVTMGALDGYMYVFGKGQSETTVSASQAPLMLGQKALVTGTVFDLSPAQVGAPCVSKESVAAQMEQYHIGAPVGGALSGVMMADGSYGDVMLVGVPVSLDVLDPNGNHYNVGVVTSDGYSGTFAFDGWTPGVAGLYTITATFMGDESYGSSFATTYLTVAEGSGTSNAAGADNTLLYALIGATVAIIITIVLVGFIFRKK